MGSQPMKKSSQRSKPKTSLVKVHTAGIKHNLKAAHKKKGFMADHIAQGATANFTTHIFDASGAELTALPAGATCKTVSADPTIATVNQPANSLTFTGTGVQGGAQVAFTSTIQNADGSTVTATDTVTIDAPPAVKVA